MKAKHFHVLLAALAGFAAATGVNLALLPGEDPAPLACRPSAPEKLASEAPILILGNSLAFDADWRTNTAQTVNCARQGLTAAAALPLIDALPDITPKAVVLVFGTVELVRGTADPETFHANIVDYVGMLSAKYMDAPIVVLGVPTTKTGWSYDLADAQALNVAIAEVDNVSMLPIDPILTRLDGPVSYDGVHLTPSVYHSIRAALETHLAIGLATE